MPSTSAGSSGFEVVDEYNKDEGETIAEVVDENKPNAEKKTGESEIKKGGAEALKHKPASLDDVVYELDGITRQLSRQIKGCEAEEEEDPHVSEVLAENQAFLDYVAEDPSLLECGDDDKTADDRTMMMDKTADDKTMMMDKSATADIFEPSTCSTPKSKEGEAKHIEVGIEFVGEHNKSEAEKKGCEFVGEAKGKEEKQKGEGEAITQETASLLDVVHELKGIKRKLEQQVEFCNAARRAELSSFAMPPDKVSELMTGLNEEIKKLLTNMPARELNEDPRIKLMHAAEYFQDYFKSFHSSQGALQAEKAKQVEVEITYDMNYKAIGLVID